MATVDASFPRFLYVASTIYHGLSVFTWFAAFGHHVLFQINILHKDKRIAIQHFNLTQISKTIESNHKYASSNQFPETLLFINRRVFPNLAGRDHGVLSPDAVGDHESTSRATLWDSRRSTASAASSSHRRRRRIYCFRKRVICLTACVPIQKESSISPKTLSN